MFIYNIRLMVLIATCLNIFLGSMDSVCVERAVSGLVFPESWMSDVQIDISRIFEEHGSNEKMVNLVKCLQKAESEVQFKKCAHALFIWAVENDYASLASTLLRFKNLIDVHQPNDGGETPLILASIYGCYKIVKLLLDHIKKEEINYVDKKRRSALFYAAMRGHKGIVQLLLNHGADFGSSHEGIQQSTINALIQELHRNDRMDIIELFLKHNQKHKNKFERYVLGALYVAIFYQPDRLDLIQLFLTYGVDPLKHIDCGAGCSENARDLAESIGADDIVELIDAHVAHTRIIG